MQNINRETDTRCQKQQPIYQPFIQDDLSELVLEKTFNHSHPHFLPIMQHL